MKTSNKLLFYITMISFVGTIIFSPTLVVLFRNIYNLQSIALSAIQIVALAFLSLLLFCTGFYLTKLISSLPIWQKLFWTTVPITFMFGFCIFSVFSSDKVSNPQAVRVMQILNITNNSQNILLWTILLAVLYVAILFLIFYIICKPIRKVSKAIERLGDGQVRTIIEIGGGKQFKEIEYNLNKINNNYKNNITTLKQTKQELEKFIPKQFLKYLGKDNITQLESGNSVKKEVTTMFCDIRNSTAVSTTLSLEENFNYINSYLKIVAPIVRKHNGFIDKYLGDGVIAVFISPELAIQCAHSIHKSIQLLNKNSNLPQLELGVSIYTGDVIFGVVGDELRKSPTIISEAVNFAAKMEELNKKFGSSIIFSKSTLDSLPSNYPLAYRFIGNLKLDKKDNIISIFESLEYYDKSNRMKLLRNKLNFEKAVRLFNLAKFAEAKDLFYNVYKNEKEDKVCYLYYNKSLEGVSGGKSALRLKNK